ncbi:hypothetical protein [uncultured Solobacterium sp.]|uniref:hypothetical protein n=1 Tax=uncultured Solobacterium sp. TaxID=747375 RepID=UPI0028E6A837|nr:hypothetical protein [uncultured Solobacterium sp.]
MKKTIPIILITLFSCVLAGCSTRRQVSQEVTSSNEVTQVEEESGYAYKLSELHEINQNDLVSSDTSQFYDLEGNPIDMREISLKRGEYYLIDDCSIAISEVILSPIQISANYKVLKDQYVEFANSASYSSVENDNIQMKNILQRIIGFNTILPISHNLSQIQFIPSSDIVITIYFYPICYKVETFYYKYENPSDTFYTLKGAHQFDGLYCDGIYEVRTVENQLNMKES